ncbi:alpha-amylase family glycosyl hydrolase [Catenovulum adriaticum]|uniref:Alpha-amylase family glycosyl hydrolase n=1 Tax=Catenovulum adriaticum TaxID=2984846 RepID=A0ABY7ATB4_9ALTE|nr:alpha-amylase family glycosyl hydrolase [Catenovulum sp. TS8]WAJ72012.1 alpha-amylase family glycosyl hydrolase [Catenovulum sp. TS8]
MSLNNDANLGLIKLDKGYSVRVWAPNAAAVAIRGQFNDWDEEGVELNKTSNGIWYVDLEALKNGEQYQFVITTEGGDKLNRNDPRSRFLTNSVGASIVYDDIYQWPETQFKLETWNKLVIYELHIGTFNQPESENAPGTFESAIEKLDYLAELGVNCIEIMPVNEFAGDYSWGYNPAYPFAVEEAYGGPDGLKHFVQAAHERNIGVILDVVYNHFGPSDLHLWQFDGWSENDKGGIYFYNDWRSSTPWGDTRPDYGRKEVRQYIFDNAMMWLDEFRLDGLRMDMIPFMRSVSGSETPDDMINEAYDLLRWINRETNNRFPNKLIIAEDLHGNDFVTDSIDNGGLGYGAQWDADFVHPIRDILTQPDDESRDLDKVAGALTRRYNDQTFNRIIYVESHDEIANGQARLAEEIAPGNVDDDFFARQRSVIGAALTLTAPGIPMLFQGQELLEDLWFDDNDPIDWSRLDQFPQLNKAYQTLINLRKNKQGLSAGLCSEQLEFVHIDQVNKVIAYRRNADTQETGNVLVFINLKNEQHKEYTVDNLGADDWKCIFDWHAGFHKPEKFKFDQPRRKGNDEKNTVQTFKFTLEAYQVLLFSDKLD